MSEDRLVALPACGTGVERNCHRLEDNSDESEQDVVLTTKDDQIMTSSNAFESHVEYDVPGSDVNAFEGDPSKARTLHVFRLAPRWREAVMVDLLSRAMAKTKKGYQAKERLVQGADGGVMVSNVGGFQSAHDLLEPNTWCYTSDEDSEDDVVGENAPAEGAMKKKTHPLKGWGYISHAVRAAHDLVRDPSRGERAITCDDVYGWLNANDGGDFNKLHEHGGENSWSGVFYVQCPPPSRPPPRRAASWRDDDASSDDDSDAEGSAYGIGALGLRCHDASAEKDGKVKYLRFQPNAGDLLLFRGDVLHAVESNGWAVGGAKESSEIDFSALRLSVAFNEDSLANDGKIAERAACER